MTEEVRKFLGRLKSVNEKAYEERVTVRTIYDRILKGIYEIVEIGGMKFIIEPEEEGGQNE